ncbi:MAG: STAS domain-containing protein [Candidatus Gracilibacteria bacterium]
MGLLTLKFTTDVRDNDYEVVEFYGELDQSTIGNAEKMVFELLEKYDRKFLIFDFTNLTFTNSEGIGFIVDVNTKLVDKKKQLILCGLRPNVAEVLEAMGVPKLFHVFSKINEAISFTKQ